MPAWYLLHDPETYKDPQGIVAVLPEGLRSKQKLLGCLADRLQFPHYFGHNWDALEECLRDLHWLPAGRVSIVHPDLPFGVTENRATYLAILRNAVEHWQRETGRELRVVFAPSCASELG